MTADPFPISMTGSGGAHVYVEGRELTLEIRTQNHKGFEIRTRAGTEIASLVPEFETRVRQTLLRGRVDAVLELSDRDQDAPLINLERARKAFEQLVLLRDELAPRAPLPLSLLSSVPEIFHASTNKETLRSRLSEATDTALSLVVAARAREGRALAQDLTQRVATMRLLVGEVQKLSAGDTANFARRLREKMRELAEDTATKQRLEYETVLYAERIDITEELVRFSAHLDETGRTLATANAQTPIGKRLDFLAQELTREASTMAQKTHATEAIHRLIDLKLEVDRIREQVQNLL